MPILHRTYRDPVRPAAAVQLAWPASIALIVFTVFLAQATLVMALVMALATLVAGGILLTLMFGTTWVTQLPRLVSRHRCPPPLPATIPRPPDRRPRGERGSGRVEHR